MSTLHIIWEPYADVIDTLPRFLRAGRNIWHARVALICFSIVEHHYPDRVLRQFGIKQPRPRDCMKHTTLHKVTRQGRLNEDWRIFHKEYIKEWNNRLRLVYGGPPSDGQMRPDDPYMVWYKNITRRSVCPFVSDNGILPSASTQRLMVSIQQ